jgi:hypothetical protein
VKSSRLIVAVIIAIATTVIELEPATDFVAVINWIAFVAGRVFTAS